MPRHFRLNASGLNAAEYDLFTSSLESVLLIAGIPIDYLKDGDSDDHYDNVEVGAQFVWDWFQSRYNHITISIMEKIFKWFLPELEMDNTLVGWEFFAILRLVIHAENGMVVKGKLIFEQTKPSYASVYSQMQRKRKTIPERDLEQEVEPEPEPEANEDDEFESGSEEGPLQKKVKLREVALEDRVTLTPDNPLRCVRCIQKNIECRINPAHIPALVKWKDTPGWRCRPRHTACLHCESWAKSCRLPGMKVKPPQDVAEWRALVTESLERIEGSVDKLIVQRSEEPHLILAEVE